MVFTCFYHQKFRRNHVFFLTSQEPWEFSCQVSPTPHSPSGGGGHIDAQGLLHLVPPDVDVGL